MSNLFIILLLTMVTGLIFYGAGKVFGKLWFYRDVKLVRLQMEITYAAFLVPFVYIILYLRMRGGSMTAGSSVNLFYGTLWIRRLYALLGAAWVILFLRRLRKKLKAYSEWREFLAGNIPEEDEETEAIFRRVCGELGIRKRITLCRNDLADTAYIAYSHGFVVILPLVCYTKEETEVILYHELCHYLNGDYYFKRIGTFVSLLHVFNPYAERMQRELGMLCEECCDRKACEKGKGVFSEKQYFGAILSTLDNRAEREKYDLFALADNTGNCERRAKCMREYHDHGGFKKVTAAALIACFTLGSSMTALAAGELTTGVYEAAADVTDARAEENVGRVEVTEATAFLSDEEVLEEFARAYDLSPEDVVMMGEEGIETIGDAIYVDWNIPAGKTYMTSGFSEEVGNKVTVTTVASPSDIRYQMGIKDPNELMRYAEGTGDMAHNFSITIKGRYYFFVTNLDSSRELNVRGTVMK